MTLTAQDVSDLERIEERIERNQKGFFEMAEDLVTIRDRKLYLREYKTFESYCQNRWGWTRQWVNQQIRSAEVIRQLSEKSLETVVSKNPTGIPERAVRALSAIPQGKREEVIDLAAQNEGPLSAANITESAKAVAAAPPQKAKSGKSEEPAKRKDGIGWIIPDALVAVFDRGESIERMIGKLSDVRGWVRRMQESPEAIFFAEISANQLLVEMDRLYADLKRAVPFAVCPVCQGIKVDSCRACKKRGVISRFMWDHAIDEQTKELRKKAMEDK